MINNRTKKKLEREKVKENFKTYKKIGIQRGKKSCILVTKYVIIIDMYYI
jgi:hypothetical protein